MEQVQGYLTLCPNDPTGRGMLHYNVESAQRARDDINALIPLYDKGLCFNKEHWKNKPEPWEIYELVIGAKL